MLISAPGQALAGYANLHPERLSTQQKEMLEVHESLTHVIADRFERGWGLDDPITVLLVNEWRAIGAMIQQRDLSPEQQALVDRAELLATAWGTNQDDHPDNDKAPQR